MIGHHANRIISGNQGGGGLLGFDSELAMLADGLIISGDDRMTIEGPDDGLWRSAAMYLPRTSGSNCMELFWVSGSAFMMGAIESTVQESQLNTYAGEIPASKAIYYSQKRFYYTTSASSIPCTGYGSLGNYHTGRLTTALEPINSGLRVVIRNTYLCNNNQSPGFNVGCIPIVSIHGNTKIHLNLGLEGQPDFDYPNYGTSW